MKSVLAGFVSSISMIFVTVAVSFVMIFLYAFRFINFISEKVFKRRKLINN